MRIKGLDKVMRDFNKYERDIETIAKDTVNEIVSMMITDAKAKAPRDLGRLIDSINKESKDNGWTVVFFVGEVYGAFQEFGTGARVDVPAELADIASSLRGYKSGNFDDFLTSIEEWCGRKGIPRSATYPIAVSILNKGFNPQPYFYPAYLANRDKIISLMTARITQLLKR